MNIKIITENKEFLKLKEDWEILQEKDPDVTYYNTYIFNKTWWKVYSESNDKSLFIICVYDNRKLEGIAPFIIEEHKKAFLSYRVLKFMGRGDYYTVISNKKNNRENTIIRQIFKGINDNSDKWERIELTHIKQNSSLAYYLLRHNLYNESFTYQIECPVVYINRFSSFDMYKNDFNIDKETKYYINKLLKKAGYSFKIYKGNQENILEKISVIHNKEQEYLINIKGRKDRKSLFKNKGVYTFLRDIYDINDNTVTFILEDNNSNIISYATCYYYKNTLYLWNTGYDPQFAKYAVCRVANYEIFKYIYENDFVDIFDFGAGRYPWKFKWTKDFIFNYKLDLWNSKSNKAKIINLLLYLKQLL